MLGGQYGQGAVRIQSALDKLPAERFGALWLYIARLRSGELDSAKRDLQATFARSKDDEWPAPIADFYLDRIGADGLLAEAGKGKQESGPRSCQATAYIAELRAAQGDKAQADALLAAARSHCAPAPSPGK
jgi:lipoprotein NlpI